MFVPIPDIQLPNGGEIHANSTLDAEGNHAVALNFIFPAAFPLSVVLPTGFHICKNVVTEADTPADPFMPSPEVRAALQTVFDTVVYTQQEYSEARRVLQSWVRGWPAE